MDQLVQIASRVLPIFILIGLGSWVRRSNFLPEGTIEDLKKITVNLALPAVLFVSFLNTELKVAYLAIFALTFLVCVALLWLGQFLKKQRQIPHPYFPYLMTGFEYGMLGISLFGSVYGLENIGYIAVMDLGHELFIWFVFLAFLLKEREGIQGSGQLVRAFFRSPVVIGILLGIILNIVGAQRFLYDFPLTGAVMTTLQYLANLTIPLILIIIGYGLKLDRSGVKEALPVVLIRLVILIPLALLVNAVLIRGILQLGPAFEAALFTLFILPPPFIIPLYVRPDLTEEKRYINNVLTLYTIVSIIIFTLYLALNPAGLT